MKKSLLLSVFSLLTLAISAQKEANYWYFGKNAGIEFKGGKPEALENGALSTNEGCTVISDASGKLLFYSDGTTVWNANHDKMPNGVQLKGSSSSTSSGVAIPKPNNPGIYYLFTVAKEAQQDGLCYSVVDMSMENGLGDVLPTAKNIQLDTLVTEKITAVGHRNGNDVWVIAHKWKSDEFLAYLVTENGVSLPAVSTNVGAIHKGVKLNTQGYLKSNPDGSNLALALEADGVLELFDFDNSTGVVSNPISVTFPKTAYIYGIEFSPNGSLIYVSGAGVGEIYQFNLQLETVEEIQASMLKIGESPDKKWIGALQLANDGKIYFPIYETEYLGVIHNPNELGTACGYEDNYVHLNGKLAQLGLPTFSQKFFIEEMKKEKVTYFNANKVELNKAIVLKNINFDFAKHSLKPSSYDELNGVVGVLVKNPPYTIQLNGHTDNVGNKSANLTLSINRAKSVEEYLISKGIDSSRISSKGYGSVVPIASNSTEDGRNTNRRVELVLLGE